MTKQTAVQKAMRVIGNALKLDEGYWQAWQANIAMAYVDNYRWYCERHGIKRAAKNDLHIIANESAAHFIRVCWHIPPVAPKPKTKAKRRSCAVGRM